MCFSSIIYVHIGLLFHLMYFLHRTASDLASLKSKHIHYKQVKLSSDSFIPMSTVTISGNVHIEVDIIYFKILAFYFSVIL